MCSLTFLNGAKKTHATSFIHTHQLFTQLVIGRFSIPYNTFWGGVPYGGVRGGAWNPPQSVVGDREAPYD